MNRRMMKVMVGAGMTAVTVAVGLGALSGCNTVRGVGEDITEASDNTKRAITGESKNSAHGGAESRNRE